MMGLAIISIHNQPLSSAIFFQTTRPHPQSPISSSKKKKNQRGGAKDEAREDQETTSAVSDLPVGPRPHKKKQPKKHHTPPSKNHPHQKPFVTKCGDFHRNRAESASTSRKTLPFLRRPSSPRKLATCIIPREPTRAPAHLNRCLASSASSEEGGRHHDQHPRRRPDLRLDSPRDAPTRAQEAAGAYLTEDPRGRPAVSRRVLVGRVALARPTGPPNEAMVDSPL